MCECRGLPFAQRCSMQLDVLAERVHNEFWVKENLRSFDCNFFLSLHTQELYYICVSISRDRNNPLVYSRLPMFSQIDEFTLFTIKEFQRWLQYSSKKNSWEWPFLKQKQMPLPYYIPKTISDKTLIFESRFESGNLLLAVKVSDNEYKLMLQNDSLTKGNTQCTPVINS